MKLDVVYNKSCQRMDEVPDGSVDMIMTSPPYWGLRNYGEDVREIWGGDPACCHRWDFEQVKHDNLRFRGEKSDVRNEQKLGIHSGSSTKSGFCVKCGAWYGQLGLEPTLKMYIDHLLLVTLECKRVLKPTGVMWWNHGDSYFTGKGSCHNPGGGNKFWKSWNERKGIYPTGMAAPNRMSKESPPKCLAVQNYRLLIRMIDEQGWILRNDVKWNKPNGMPSSTKDRLANKYEPVFCLVKNTRPRYYWNEKTGLMADRKPPKDKQKEGIDWHWVKNGQDYSSSDTKINSPEAQQFNSPRARVHRQNKRKKKTYWHSLGYWYDLDAIREPHKESSKKRYNYSLEGSYTPGNAYLDEKREKPQHYNLESLKSVGKNPGDVWTIATQPRPEAHFATFPDALCIKPILATCPSEICKKCGKARVRITKPSEKYAKELGQSWHDHKSDMELGQRKGSTVGKRFTADYQTIGWTGCGCNVGFEPGIVLDPFAGRGTALIMAKKLGRHFIGYELKKEYCEKLIRPALEEIDPLFAKEEGGDDRW